MPHKAALRSEDRANVEAAGGVCRAVVDFTDPATVGYSLIALGVVLFLIEASVPGFFIAVPATILIILGVAAFYTPFDVFLSFAPAVVVLVGLPATAVTIWIYRKMAPPSSVPTTRSADSLVGSLATVTRTVEPNSTRGKVRVGREVWSATTDGPSIPDGSSVRITRVEGVILNVTPASTAPSETRTETR